MTHDFAHLANCAPRGFGVQQPEAPALTALEPTEPPAASPGPVRAAGVLRKGLGLAPGYFTALLRRKAAPGIGGAGAAPKPAARQQQATEPADPDAELFTGGPEVRAAREIERRRMQAILASPAGQRQPALARSVAFNSSMPTREAIAFVASVGEQMGGAKALAARQASASMDRAFAKAAATR